MEYTSFRKFCMHLAASGAQCPDSNLELGVHGLGSGLEQFVINSSRLQTQTTINGPDRPVLSSGAAVTLARNNYLERYLTGEWFGGGVVV